jgi:hypothetical protein
MVYIPLVKAEEIFRQRLVLNHKDGKRIAIFEIVVWKVPATKDYPNGVKYRAWFFEGGKTVFGFDNHKPKGPHLHVGEVELGYVFRGLDELRDDIVAMIRREGFVYED